MTESCECFAEVARLHEFFQNWFQGLLAADQFELCEQALAPGFTIVTPGGDMVERDEILEAIKIHRGGETPDFRIDTVGRACRQVRGLHITTYEEHQAGARSTTRLSTAVLGDDGGQLRWHAVHETWITV